MKKKSSEMDKKLSGRLLGSYFKDIGGEGLQIRLNHYINDGANHLMTAANFSKKKAIDLTKQWFIEHFDEKSILEIIKNSINSDNVIIFSQFKDYLDKFDLLDQIKIWVSLRYELSHKIEVLPLFNKLYTKTENGELIPITAFKDGKAVIKSGSTKKYGVIDINFKIIIDPEYNAIGRNANGDIFGKKEDGSSDKLF